jgi:hypothetical protein
MIKSERYGGGQRWYCDQCDIRFDVGDTGESTGSTISWTNSTPPEICKRCINKALEYYKAKLAEETERFGVMGISDAFIENNSWKVIDPEDGAGQIWADLTKQSGLQLVVNWAPGNPQVVYAVLSKEPIPHPDHYYELWYIVQTLGDKKEKDGEKAESIHLYEGPYKLEMELF